MNKKSYIGVGIVLVALVLSLLLVGVVDLDFSGEEKDDVEFVNESNVPREVVNSKPVARVMYENVTEYYPESNMYIMNDGWIVIEISTDAETGDELRDELRRVALQYSDVVSNSKYEPQNMSVVTGEVEMVIPEITVEKHSNGNLTDEAYIQTIEVKEVEREDRNKD